MQLITNLQLILFVVMLEYGNLALNRQSHYYSADLQRWTRQVKAA